MPINPDYDKLGQFDVPTRFHGSHIGNFSDGVQKQVGEINPVGYFISGPAGVGKTHLAVAIMKRMIALGIGDVLSVGSKVRIGTSALFTTCPEFLGRIMSGFQTGKAEEMLLGVQKKKILLLDDLGAEKSSEWTFSALYRVVSHRYDNFLPIIVTSNLSLKEIDAWEPRIASRLSGLKVIMMQGKDKRIAG